MPDSNVVSSELADRVTLFVQSQRQIGSGSRPPEIRVHFDTESAAVDQMQVILERGSDWAAVIQIGGSHGSFAAVDFMGHWNVARFCTFNGYQFTEVATSNPDRARVVNSGQIVNRAGKTVPWTSLTAAGSGLPAPSRAQSHAGNRLMSPIVLNFGAASAD